MVDVTRLRWISAASKEELEQAVNGLPFKIEIKAIQPDKTGWVVFFVIPENERLDLTSFDLRK